MKNHECNAINLTMQQNKTHNAIAKDNNGILGPNDFSFIDSK